MKKIKKPGIRGQKKKRSRASSGKGRKTAWLNVLPHDLWIEVQKGTTLLQALPEAGLELETDCGGLGKCGKCKVRVLTSLNRPAQEEIRKFLSEEELRQGVRLACRTKIRKHLTVYVGESEPELDYFQILKTGQAPQIELDPLVDKRLVQLPGEGETEPGLADLDRIRAGLGSGYQELRGSLQVLRSLPEAMSRNGREGTAVLHSNALLAWQPREAVDSSYGLVFDLGTSTVVGKLVSLTDGHQLAAISRLNSQSRYGADVISRLQYLQEHPDGLETLHKLLVQDLRFITLRLLEVAQIDHREIFVAVAAGNTTMQHLLLQLDPLSIAEAPFSPVLTDGIVVRAAEAGLVTNPEAQLYVMPSRSGYIGGDMISVILASEAAEQDEKIILGLDLGTNGEIFLGNAERLMTCSAAAGPALEGAKISHGTIAKAGAIEGVRYDEAEGRLHYQDIGNIKPTGICGSGLVDLVAVLANCGVIDQEGLIRPPQDPRLRDLRARVIERDGVCDFLVASPAESYHGKAIYLTQMDVRELQFAKAAIAAGIQTLLNEFGITPRNLGHIYLAGALGNYVNPYSAMRIGLIPTIHPRLITSLGNAASTGGSMLLLSKSYWRKANDLARFIEHVELSSRADFSRSFIANLDLPPENPWERRFT